MLWRKSFFFLSHDTDAWGHPVKLMSGRIRAQEGKVALHTIIINLWNSLLLDIVMVTILDPSYRALDR